MGHLPTILGVKRVTLNWHNAADQHVHNVLHCSTTRDAADTANTLDGLFTDNMWSDVSDEFHIFDIDVLPLDGTSGTTVHTVTSAHATGLASGEYLPAYAAKVELRTGLRGREHRGRLLLGPITEGSVTDGTIVGTGIDDMATAWNAFNTALAALSNPINLGVASYKHSSFTVLDTIFTTRTPAVLRRRQRHLVG